MENAKYSGKAISIRKFALYEHDYGNYPCLVETRSKKAKQIEGELFEIKSQELLDRIDSFERVPDYYRRERVKVKKGHSIILVDTYIYNSSYIPENKVFYSKWIGKKKKNKDLNSCMELLRAFGR